MHLCRNAWEAADQQCKDPHHPRVPRADRDVYPSGRDVTLALRHCHSSEPWAGQAVALFQLRDPGCRSGVFLMRGLPGEPKVSAGGGVVSNGI